MANDGVGRSKQILEEKYGCHTIILYGSYAQGSADSTSDVDMLGVTDSITRTKRHAEKWRGIYLDLFIFPESKLEKADPSSMYLLTGRVLKEKDGQGTKFLNQLRELEKSGFEELAEDEIMARKVWARKMFERAKRGDPEGNYRRMWLTITQLEDYFHIRKLWYRGSKQSLKWLQDNDTETYDLFVKCLSPISDLMDIEKLIQRVWNGKQ